MILLYIKEKVDYNVRKVLFSFKGDYIHKLYQFIHKIGLLYNVEQILQVLRNEVSQHLELKVCIFTYNLKTKQVDTIGAHPLISERYSYYTSIDF